jgi:signal transduction histidine kinase
VKPFRYALLLASFYGCVAGAYIAWSTDLAAQFANNLQDLHRIEQVKGQVFVATTALLLFGAAWFLMARFKRVAEERETLQRAAAMSQSRILAGEYAAAVAHDFNNVLLVTASIIDEIQENPSSGVDRSLLREATEAIERGRNLSLRLARSARGRHTLRRERLGISMLTRTMVRSLAKLQRVRACQVSVEANSEYEAEIDPTLFEQILTNLIINAADAAGERGQIRVVVAGDAQQVRLEVHDSGPGIPAEKRETIFKAFETTKSEGLGLGLLSVRTAANMLGGGVSVEDSPLGGAKFIVRLSSASSSVVVKPMATSTSQPASFPNRASG